MSSTEDGPGCLGLACMLSDDTTDAQKYEIGEEEVAIIGRDIDALVLEQEETENARSLHSKERSADQRYVIEYVRSCDDDDDDDNGEASYNAQAEGVVVSLDASTSVSLRGTTTDVAADNTSVSMIEQSSAADSAEEGEPVEVVLDESDDESAASSTPTDVERTTATKKKRSSSRPTSKVTSTLKRSVGCLRRGLGSLQRSRSRGETTTGTDYCINQDLNKTLQLDDAMLSSPDTSTSHHAMSYNGHDAANLDDDSSDDSSSLDETSSAQLRRRVVEVETRVQSQISEAKSFDSQQSQYALVHGATSDHRGIRSSDGRGQLSVDLGGYFSCGERLETSDDVKTFRGLPMFIEQGIYDTVIPARSADEYSVTFIEAPPTTPLASGLLGVSFDSDEDDRSTTGSAAGGEKDGGAGSKKSKRRPLAFLRKKQRATSANIEH